jgi:hypothetical protein
MELSPYEKPPVAQLLKNFPTFYATQRFITVFTTVHHLATVIIFIYVLLFGSVLQTTRK